MDQFVVLYTGRQGESVKGDAGDTGPQGPGFRARGVWSDGTSYAPGDAVVAAGSVAAGINSLFIQRTTSSESPSTIAPRDDGGRWLEVGAADLSNVTGTIWRVIQINHGFTQVGTPVGYRTTADRWVSASNKVGDEVALGVVREVVSPGEFIIQTTGEITGLDPALIRPDGTAAFTPGKLYYVSRLRGRLTETPSEPTPGFASNAMLMATGPTSGVVLQWQQTPNVTGRRPVGFNEFYYDADPGQTVFGGADLDGNTLTYQVSDQNQVFVDGLLLTQFDDYTAGNGLSVVLSSALSGGERVVVRAIAEPLQAIAPATALPADNIGPLFDGSERRFPFTVGGGNALTLGPSQNAIVFLDGNAQEPFTDYRLIAGATTDTDIEFTNPPASGSRFWAIVGTAVSNLSFIDVNTLLAQTGTVQTLNFDTGVGDDLTLDTLEVTGQADFADMTATDATIAVATIAGLAFTSAAGTTLGVSGTATIGTVAATTVTTGALTATGAAALNTVSASGLASLASLSVSGASTLNTLNVSGAANFASLTASGNVSAATMNVSGTAEAATVRAGTLRGPLAGGSVTALDLVVDEGVF